MRNEKKIRLTHCTTSTGNPEYTSRTMHIASHRHVLPQQFHHCPVSISLFCFLRGVSEVHGSALLVIFFSLSSRLEFEIPAHSYFVSSFDTAPATISKLKKNRSCTFVINNIQKRSTLPQVPIISVECTVLRHRSQLG